MKNIGGLCVKLRVRWVVASIIVAIVLFVNQLEERNVIQSNIQKIVSSSEDIVWMQQTVRAFLQKEQQQVTVTTPIHSQKLLEFVNVSAQQDGYLLTFDQIPSIVALQDGYILFTGHQKTTGKTMIVKYGDVSVTYGHLDNFNQLPYTTIKTGEILALKGKDTPLFLKMEANGVPLNLEQILPMLQQWEVQ